MSQRLLVVDLVRIPGLDNYVRDSNWLQVDNIRVYDLVTRLFTRLMRQESIIRNGEQQLRSIRFDRDGIRAALDNTERELSNCRRELERTRMELRNARRERNDYGYANQPSSSQQFGNPYAGRPSNPGIRNPYAGQRSTPEIRNPYADQPSNTGFRNPPAGQPSRNFAAPRSPFVAPENRTDLRRGNDVALPPVPRRAPNHQSAQDVAWFRNHGGKPRR